MIILLVKDMLNTMYNLVLLYLITIIMFQHLIPGTLDWRHVGWSTPPPSSPSSSSCSSSCSSTCSWVWHSCSMIQFVNVHLSVRQSFLPFVCTCLSVRPSVYLPILLLQLPSISSTTFFVRQHVHQCTPRQDVQQLFHLITLSVSRSVHQRLLFLLSRPHVSLHVHQRLHRYRVVTAVSLAQLIRRYF